MAKKAAEKQLPPLISFLILIGVMAFLFSGYLFLKWR